tara:strand:+ start:1167 stop:1487 length:321 start_codon:yes stop_codon:yes gene_type:complete
MTDKIVWHKTERGNKIVVDSDADMSQWPDYEDEKREHHLGHTDEEIAEMDRLYREDRDAELARTDYMMLPDMNPTQELIDYRQALRDAPAYPDWPLKTPNIERINT